MYLSRLIIKNYRSIKQLDLIFKKGKNIIVGRNNSGKSNIIKAIDLVLGENSPTYEKSENICETDFYNGDMSKAILIFCELSREEGEELNYEELNKCFGFKIDSIISKWESGKPIKESVRHDLSYSDFDGFIKGLQQIFKLSENNDSDYINSKLKNQKSFEGQFCDKYKFAYAFAAFRDPKDGRIIKEIRFLYRENNSFGWVVAFKANIRNELLQSAIIPSFRDPQNQLRISNWSWYGKLLKKSINPENEKLRNAFEAVKNASNEVFSFLQEKINDSKIKIAFPDTNISFQFNPDAKQDVHKSALIYVDDGFKSQLGDKGSGIQSAIIIGLFHFYTREIAHINGSLLAIEEPELYLHPHGRRVISNRLDDFLEGGKNQVIITTHSSEFINSAQENLNIIIVKKLRNETYAENASFESAKEKQILIRGQNAEMFFADVVILVEGGGDKYIIEAITEELGEKKKLGRNWINDFNISIIPVGGKTEFWKYSKKLDEVKIRWYILADFDFFLRGLAEFLTKTDLDILRNEHNSLNGRLGANKNIKDKNNKKDTALNNFFKKLRERGIFILKGELEDYYSSGAKDLIKGLSGKEERALKIVLEALENGHKISQFIDTKEYHNFLEFVIKEAKISESQ